MKTKFVFAKSIILISLAGTFISSTVLMNAFAKSDVPIQNDIIKPLSHIRGEEINTLPYSIQDLYNLDVLTPDTVFPLYDADPEMSSSNWKLTGPKDYAKKYFRTGTTSVSAKHNGTNISVPVLYTDSGKFSEKTNILLTIEGDFKNTYSAGQQFDKTNLTIMVHTFDSNANPKFAIENVTSKVSYSGTSLNLGQTYVTASYSGLDVKIPIFVGSSKSASEIIGYTFSGNYKTLYKDWDAFNSNSLKVIAHFADSSTKDVTSELTWPSNEFDSTLATNSAHQASLYEKWDSFHQINNVLKWEVKDGIEVEDYDVIVSMNPELTEVVFKAKVEEPMYQMTDIYTGEEYYWQVKVNQTNGKSIKSPIYNFTIANTPRTVIVQGLSNTRDIGGSISPFGEYKQGYVYRGSRVDEATEAGLKVFKDKLGIQTDVDLRTPNTEVGRNNPLDLPYYVGPVDLGMYSNFDPVINADPVERAKHLAKLKIALEPFTHEENYPIYFHCSVGRDRTGTLGSIIDALMGVDPTEILRKYLVSVFSVTGHYDLDNYQAGITNGISLLTMLNNHKGTTIYEKAESLVKEAGLSDEQIQKIRDILTGKTDAKNSLKFIENDDNYEGQIIVHFKQSGNDEETVFAAPGSIVAAPYELKEGYAWYDGDTLVDLSKPLYESVSLVSKRQEKFKVVIHYVKGEKADQTLDVRDGDLIKISDFAIDGKIPRAYLDSGKEITVFEAYRNATINLIFE